MINNIKKDFDRVNDISEDLQKFEYKSTDNWNPILKASKFPDEDLKGGEDRQFELQFKVDYGESQKRKMFHQENKYKAYGLIWERCVTAMKARIEARKYFEDSIYNNPIKFLKAINHNELNYQ